MNPTTETLNDARLVELLCNGDRDAFGRIVERYQSLICALTYSASGSVQASEDLAQVTFITAWSQLRNLREPAKLKSWLCRIARNVTTDSFRQQQRTPTANAEVLEKADNVPGDATTPRDHVISKEEQAVLWRVLEGLPATYREPLILFYRQEQSVADVAEALELTEDAVKQRLSRGRTMLSERTAEFIKTALHGSGPGKAFTLGVLAALPVFATSAKAAVVGATAAKGSPAAKAAAFTGIAGAILGPIIGILGSWFGAKMSIENTQSPRERQFMIKMVQVTLVFVGVFCLAIFALSLLTRFWWKTHPVLIAAGFIGTLIGYLVALMVLIFWGNRTQQRIRSEEAGKQPSGMVVSWPSEVSIQPYEYRSRWTLLGLPLIHVRMFCKQNGKVLPAKGWIAAGDIAYGALFAFGSMWAFAPISLGMGFAVGVLSLGGGFAVGLLSLGGGFSLGLWALGGGLGVGLLAFGGCAVGWTAAQGGAAFAHEFARGGLAVAKHANDAVATDFFQNSALFQTALAATRHARWLQLVWLLPVGLVLWRNLQARRRSGA